MKISKLIDELQKIQTQTGKDLDVFIETVKIPFWQGDYDFCVKHNFHEPVDKYEGIDEISLLIIRTVNRLL